MILYQILKACIITFLFIPLFAFASETKPMVLPNSLSATPPSENATGQTPEYVLIQSSAPVTYSSETAASVAELNVKEGSHFKMNDILLTLDCRIQKAELEKAKAEAAAADIAQKGAKRLQSYGSISEIEFIKAMSQAKIAKADVDKLSAIVDKCVIKAPFNGAVAQLIVHPLETVKPGDPLIKIVDLDNLEVVIQVPSKWLQWLKVGTKFYIQLNEINNKVSAHVIMINPEIDSVSQTVKITGQINSTDVNLLPGMSGQAIFPDLKTNLANGTN